MLAVGGETCIDVSGDESTVIEAFPLTPPNCAVMVVLPPDCAVTLPPALTLATPDADELHLTTFEIA